MDRQTDGKTDIMDYRAHPSSHLGKQKSLTTLISVVFFKLLYSQEISKARTMWTDGRTDGQSPMITELPQVPTWLSKHPVKKS